MNIEIIITEVGIGGSGPGRRVCGYVGECKEGGFSDTQDGRSVEQHIADDGVSLATVETRRLYGREEQCQWDG